MSERDSALEVIDSKFNSLTFGAAALEVLYDHAGGPRALSYSVTPIAWSGATSLAQPPVALYPRCRRFRLSQSLQLYQRQYARPGGRMISCSHGARAVLRTELDGTATTLRTAISKRLNSPNDVVVKSDANMVHRPHLRHHDRL